MKNVKNANYWQIDREIKNIRAPAGVVVLASKDAWTGFKWTRPYFKKKPEDGYFFWVKKQINFPLSSCVSICAKNIKQNLQNLLVVEKNLDIRLQGVCSAEKRNLSGVHRAQGKIILKQGSALRYEHFHSWGEKDIVETNYEFSLEKSAKLDYTYKIFSSPKALKINNFLILSRNSSVNLNIFGDISQAQAEFKDTLILREENASGIAKMRLVGRENSKISAVSQIIAESAGRGHLDCQGLLADEDSEISLIPEITCQNKNAQITHEASIGKISEQGLSYLRTRGLSEKEAINLIVNGFLKICPVEKF